jgi:Glycosyl transferase family group 2
VISDLGVIVVCHEPYLRWLPDALSSVDRQLPGTGERIVIFDGCAAPDWLPDGWRSQTGHWGHPSGARNAGVAATTAPWLIFLDADNVMPDGYLAAAGGAIAAAPPEVGIVYPDIEYVDASLTSLRRWTMPAWDYWSLRQQNCVDTASTWRRAAVEIVGGWPPGAYLEDYHLALAITAAGWTAIRMDGPAILIREHGHDRRTAHRQRTASLLTHLWQARSLAIVSLLAGRGWLLDRWTRFLLDAELPPRTALYIVDNGGDRGFSRRVRDAAELIAAERGLTHLDIATTGAPYPALELEHYLAKRRHLHVAQLYAATFPRVHEDLVYTLEDDVEPPLDAIRVLGEEIGYPARGRIGVAGGAYASPTFAEHVCAAPGHAGWTGSIAWRDLPRAPIDVGCVGGGSAMWANWALRECVTHVRWEQTLGWDGVLCSALRANCYRVRLHGAVRCQHHRLASTASPASQGQCDDAVALPTPRRPPPRLAS